MLNDKKLWLIALFFGAMGVFASLAQDEDDVILLESEDEEIETLNQDQINALNKAYDATKVILPPILHTSKTYQDDYRQRSNRYNRMRQTIESMYQSTLATGEHYTQKEDVANTEQGDVWDHITTQIQHQYFLNYTKEVHYINLDDPTFQEIDVVDDSVSNYQFKHQDKDKIISLVIFKPKEAQQKSPIVIFNHGGSPSNYIHPNSKNPQFIAYSGLKYAIICPNYRGGSPQNHTQDMAGVIQYLRQFKNLDSQKIVLAGISAGTTLNAQILDKPLIEKLAGLFLHTGLYDTRRIFRSLPHTSLPPTFLVSGAQDPLVSLTATTKYIKGLQNIAKNFKYYIVDHGGHHLISLINPQIPPFLLKPKNFYTQDEINQSIKAIEKRYNAKEIMHYVTHLVEFLDAIAFEAIPSDQRLENGEKTMEPKAQDIIHKVQVIQDLKSKKGMNLATPDMMDVDEEMKGAPYTASEAQLKIILGNDYDPHNLDRTILMFLQKYDSEKASIRDAFAKKYKPSSKEWRPIMAENTAQNKELRYLIRKILQKEQDYKGRYVLYHGAEALVGFIYDVYSTLRRGMLLEANPKDPTLQVKRLRALDDAFLKVFSSEDLIQQMRPLVKEYPDELFNYLPGYQKVGLSAQWYLFGSYKYWFNSTFFRYFRRGFSAGTISLKETLKPIFRSLGIKDEEIVKNMIKSYEQIYKTYINPEDGRLLQIFISPSIIDEVTYVSETGGFPLKLKMASNLKGTYTPSKVIPESLLSPTHFEEILRKNRPNFKNQNGKDRREFNKKKPTLKYINSLEARFFMNPSYMDDPSKIQIFNYHIHAPKPGYLEALQHQVAQDLSRWLDLSSKLSASMIYKTPPLVKLQDYVKQGTTQSSSPPPLPHQILHQTDLSSLEKGEAHEPTNLLWLIQQRREDMALKLIQGGADITMTDADGNTPLIMASLTGLTSVVNALIHKVIKTDSYHLQEYLDQKNNAQWNALFSATINGQGATALSLIHAGADIITPNKDGFTPLITASMTGLTKVVNALIQKIKQTNPGRLQEYLDWKNTSHWNALHLALIKRHSDTALALIHAGANTNITTKDGTSPLAIAQRGKLTEIVKVLTHKPM